MFLQWVISWHKYYKQQSKVLANNKPALSGLDLIELNSIWQIDKRQLHFSNQSLSKYSWFKQSCDINFSIAQGR